MYDPEGRCPSCLKLHHHRVATLQFFACFLLFFPLRRENEANKARLIAFFFSSASVKGRSTLVERWILEAFESIGLVC